MLTSFEKQASATVHVSPIKVAHTFNQAYARGERTRTFPKVQDGCNYHCTFCTIPLARGKSRSDTIKNLVTQAKSAAQQGAKEIVLTGVNIGDYGIIDTRRKANFLALIQALDQIESVARFRISSIEPNLLSNPIIEFVAHSARFVPHFHVPLQSGSNTILKRMHRRYQRELYAERIALIKSLMPQCSIGVDVIVGFPGESIDNFLETYYFLHTLDITYLHVFPYSERRNTKAIELVDKIPEQEKSRRAKMLRTLSEKKQRCFYKKNLGKTATVLFEQEISNSLMQGFTENYIRVCMPANPQLANTLQAVQLKRISAAGLVEV